VSGKSRRGPGFHRDGIGVERCALAAGLALAVLDLYLLRDCTGSRLPLLADAAAVMVVSAALGIGLSFIAWLIRPLEKGSPARSVIGAAAALPVIMPVSWLLFQGTGISQKWYAPYGPILVAPLMYLMFALELNLLGWLARRVRGAGRLLMLPPVLAWSVFFFWVDRALYPHQYLYLHWVLLLLLWFGLAAIAWIIFSQHKRWEPVGVGWLLVPALALGLLVSASVAPVSGAGIWRQVEEKSHAGGRLLEVARRLADLDGDNYSVILGEQDCDNGNPMVHPFALELPGNGVDEDCDGQDRAPPPPAVTETTRDALDAKSYRATMPTWRESKEVKEVLARTAEYNVVLIVVDALRGDYLKPLSHAKKRYPHLAQVMSRGLRFPRAVSTAAGTDVGMATLLTGQILYSSIGRRTLPMAFHGAGVKTHGIYQREVERWLGPRVARRGLSGRKVLINDPDQEEVGTRATSGRVSNWGIQFIRRHVDRRFFLWLHYFDAHEHHQIEPETLRFKGGVPPPASDRPTDQKGKYEQMVRHIDHHLGRFIRELDALDLSKKTILVLTADHGEGLAQSPRLPAHHGDLLYQPLVDIPFMIHVPGADGGMSKVPATLPDLYPTLLDLAGIRHGPGDGVSLAPFVLGKATAKQKKLHRPIFMMEGRQNAVLLWPLKLIAWRDKGRVELYDLEKDPEEKKDLATSRPEDARRLAALLTARSLSEVDRAAVYKARKWREGAPDEPGAFEPQQPPGGSPAPAGGEDADKEPGSPVTEQPKAGQKKQHRGEAGDIGKKRRPGQGKAGKEKRKKGRRDGPGPGVGESTLPLTDEPGAPPIK